MAWIESHQEIGRHPKTGRLSRSLKISRATAIGHLHLLWHWSLDFAENGDLSGFDAGEIADAAMWEGNPNTFIDALVSSGFLDRDVDALLLHDWQDYTGRLVAQREANRQRQQRFRDRRRDDTELEEDPNSETLVSRNRNVTVASPSRHGATIQNTTLQNQTGPDGEWVASQPAQAPTPPPNPKPSSSRSRKTTETPSPTVSRPSSAPTDGRVWSLVDAFHTSKGLNPPEVPEKPRRQAFNALKHAPAWVGPAEVEACTRYFLADPFYQAPGKLTVHKVADTLDEWNAAGRPASIARAGRASTSGSSVQRAVDYVRRLEEQGL